MREPLLVVGYDVRRLVRPDAQMVPEGRRAQFNRRVRCLEAVAGGMPIERAAKLHGVSPRTAKKDAVQATEEASDGTLVGFRACLPHRRRLAHAEARTRRSGRASGPHAMTNRIKSHPEVERLLESYRGGLPNGRRKNLKFDALHRQFLGLLASLTDDTGYPFNLADRGRRELLRYMRRLRNARIDAGAPEEDRSEANVRSLRDLLDLRPLERVEFDAHAVDVDLRMEVEGPDASIALLTIRRLTLLTVICTVTRYLLAHLLVLGEYNRLHVLRLFRRMLSPWRQRELIIPELAYPDGARLGLPVDAREGMPRPIIVAGDNAMAHHAIVARNGLHRFQRGLINFGKAHSPEARGLQEAFYNIVERGGLRRLPGGFEHAEDGSRRPTTAMRPEDYPLQWQALVDTMEVICAGYNISPHNGLRGRTPVRALDDYLHGGWIREVSAPAHDARGLTTIRIHPQIRGGRESGRYPFIEYHGAIYRSDKLRQARHRVGSKVTAEVDVDDLRHMVILDDSGLPWSRLQALPPWHRTAHDLHLRQQINRARSRKLLSLVGADDAVEAYAEFCRTAALSRARPADAYARLAQQIAPQPTAAPAFTPPIAAAPLPRSGRTSFASGRD